MGLVALLVVLLVVVGQPVQALAKQRIAVAQVGNPRDGLAGDPTDGEGGDPGDGEEGDPGDGDEGDPTDGNGRYAVAGDPGDGFGVVSVIYSREHAGWCSGSGNSQCFWQVAVAQLLARIQER